MTDDGSPRPRFLRRLLLATARAIALLILITGIYGALTIAMPQTTVLGRSIAAVLSGVIIFETLRSSRRPPVPAAPLVPVDAQPIIDELREKVNSIQSDSESRIAVLSQALEEARAAAATEAQARSGEGAEARKRESEIRQQYERESEHVQRAATRALDEIQRSRSANDDLRAQLERERTRATEIESQIADFKGRFAASIQELEALRAERQRTRREVEEARQKAEVEKANRAQEIQDLKRALDRTQESSQRLLQANETLTRQFEEERLRLHAEMQRMIAESKAERDEMQGEGRAVAGRLDELLAQLDRERQLSRELGATRARLDEENASLKSKLEALDLEWGAKLQKIVTELTSDHENEMGDSIAAREEARAEARSLTARVKELQEQLDSARDGRLGLLQRDDELTQRLARLEEENASLKARPEQPFPGADEAVLRERIEAEWGEKLQTIVSHIASDHEADIGKAIEEREAAKAEVRNMNIKLSALQQKLDAERQSAAMTQNNWNVMRDSLHAQIRELRDEIEALRSAPRPSPPSEPLPFEEEVTAPISALARSPEPAPADPEEERARAEVLQFAEQAHEALQRITSPGDVPLPPDEKKARVLFVHHDPALRTMWRENLDKSGFDVHTAADGLEGLRLIKTEKPDVVIADASMPKMDGRELCQLIKSNQETAGVKVILMTGIYTNEAPIDGQSREFEADELLRKPVKLEAMKTALSSLLAARAAS